MVWVQGGLVYWWPDKFPASKTDEWNNKRNIVKNNSPWKC